MQKRILPLLAHLPIDEKSRPIISILRHNLKGLAASLHPADPAQELLSKLSPRELEVCEMIRAGLSSKEIGDTLNTSPQTVEKQRQNIRKKLKLQGQNANLASFLRRGSLRA